MCIISFTSKKEISMLHLYAPFVNLVFFIGLSLVLFQIITKTPHYCGKKLKILKLVPQIVAYIQMIQVFFLFYLSKQVFCGNAFYFQISYWHSLERPLNQSPHIHSSRMIFQSSLYGELFVILVCWRSAWSWLVSLNAISSHEYHTYAFLLLMA